MTTKRKLSVPEQQLVWNLKWQSKLATMDKEYYKKASPLIQSIARHKNPKIDPKHGKVNKPTSNTTRGFIFIAVLVLGVGVGGYFIWRFFL